MKILVVIILTKLDTKYIYILLYIYTKINQSIDTISILLYKRQSYYVKRILGLSRDGPPLIFSTMLNDAQPDYVRSPSVMVNVATSKNTTVNLHIYI
jgi:hypothetical protein